MLLLGDCNDHLKEIKDNSLDLIVSDPPYGLEFMGKDWDKVVVPSETWKECYRILKPGKLAFVMCSPRQDVLSRMIVNLQDAGFRTNYTSIYWTFASGFPKAANISKLIDKKNGRYFDTSVKDYLNQKRKEKGLSFYDINKYLEAATNGGGIASALMGDKPNNELPTLENYLKLKTLLELDSRFDDLIQREEAEREVIGQGKAGLTKGSGYIFKLTGTEIFDITKPATEAAKAMEGAYVGFQPKPAVEVILVVSKGKTLTWLDYCRIPYQSSKDYQENWREDKGSSVGFFGNADNKGEGLQTNEKGRFPANLLVENDVLNDGKITKSSPVGFKSGVGYHKILYEQGARPRDYTKDRVIHKENEITDSGSYSRYFSLDQWWTKTFPFLIVPKASASERNKGLGHNIEPITKTKLVRKDEPDSSIISIYLKQARERKGLSSKQLAQHFPSVTGGVTGCVWNWENGMNVPTGEEWLKLKEILQFNDKYDKQMTEFIEVERSDKTDFGGVRQGGNNFHEKTANHHPTVKPLKLMSYLITLGSREGDLILDPFCGSGTVCIAAHQLHRKWIGIEKNPEYAEIIKKRLALPLAQLKLTAFA